MTLREKTGCKQTTKARATGHQRIKLTRAGEGQGRGGWLEDGWATLHSFSLIGFTNANLRVIISRSRKEWLHIWEVLPGVNRIIYLKGTSEKRDISTN